MRRKWKGSAVVTGELCQERVVPMRDFNATTPQLVNVDDVVTVAYCQVIAVYESADARMQTLGLFDVQALNLVTVLCNSIYDFVCGVVNDQNLTLVLNNAPCECIIRSGNGVLFVRGNRVHLGVQVQPPRLACVWKSVLDDAAICHINVQERLRRPDHDADVRVHGGAQTGAHGKEIDGNLLLQFAGHHLPHLACEKSNRHIPSPFCPLMWSQCVCCLAASYT